MKLEHKSIPISGVKALDEQGTLEAIVSVFSNVDKGKERVMPGFFAKSLLTKMPKGVWGHDWHQPVAKTLEARELAPGDPLLTEATKALGGLYIKGQFNLETQRGREAYSDLKFGTVDEFSIGFTVTKDSYDTETGVRDLIDGTLYEWSPVLAGMNPHTALLSVKEQNGECASTPKRRYCDAVDAELETLKGLIERGTAIDQLRRKDGRRLSSATRQQLAVIREQIDQLLDEGETDPDESAVDADEPDKAVEGQTETKEAALPADVAKAAARFAATEARLKGAL